MINNESHTAVILAAGKPHQGQKPTLLEDVNGSSLFDWQINSLGLGSNRPQLVVGFALEQLKELSEVADICYNKNWESTSSGYSLLCADFSSAQSLTASYSDILYRPHIVERLESSSADIAVAYDSHWRNRFVGRPQEDLNSSETVKVFDGALMRAGIDIPNDWSQSEFIGLVHFQGMALKKLKKIQQTSPGIFNHLQLSGVVEWLRLQGVSSECIDVSGDWAEFNELRDIAHFILGTKAETLARLSKMVKTAVIQDQVSFTVAQWNDEPDLYLNKIHEKFGKQHLVVRSSARSEDAFTSSNAGAYTSVLDINPENGLIEAIDEVIMSYENLQPDDQVLIQPFLLDVKLCGVAFTRTLEHGSPFYVINYDESGSTESITSGNVDEHKTLFFRKDADVSELAVEELIPLIVTLKEVEKLLNYDALDVEFALDNQGKIHLLQVRPIAIEVDGVDGLQRDVVQLQKKAMNQWKSRQIAAPHLVGKKALFGVMTDWNPAEIIGVNPGQLSFSLYKYLILDEVWAIQRAEFGYKDVRPQPLLTQFAGKPYIDIRASFNSFVPEGLTNDLSEKLVNFYIDWLERHPQLHDKVEFDVVPTCFGPGFIFWEQRLKLEAGLTSEEISELRQGLLKISQNAVRRTQSDLAQLDELERRHYQIANNTELLLLEKVRLLLDNCKCYGTLPFAHLARSAFIAVTFLKEAVTQGWLTTEAQDSFLASVQTVSHELSGDAWETAEGSMSWDDFVERYGHLRPGTYDITSPAYREQPEVFLRPLVDLATEVPFDESFESWELEKQGFLNRLIGSGIDVTPEDLELFLRQAIEGREKAKFIFTRSLSLSLDLISEIGLELDLSRKELSELPVKFILDLADNIDTLEDAKPILKAAADKNRKMRVKSHACKLPSLITQEKDFISFVISEDQPNYIGSTKVTAGVVHLTGVDSQQKNVENCIVLIPQADPGYDWLFGQKIAGLVTMYGGSNSHMAIRSAEFGLPAAIGVGEQLFNKLKKAKTLEIDPAGATMRVIH